MMSGEAGNIPGLDSILRGEIMRKDGLVTQLLNQNKEVRLLELFFLGSLVTLLDLASRLINSVSLLDSLD